MTDPHWPFPSLKYPLTPPKPIEYADYALLVSAEIKTQATTQDALL
jgi:hypothetical protein